MAFFFYTNKTLPHSVTLLCVLMSIMGVESTNGGTELSKK